MNPKLRLLSPILLFLLIHLIPNHTLTLHDFGATKLVGINNFTNCGEIYEEEEEEEDTSINNAISALIDFPETDTISPHYLRPGIKRDGFEASTRKNVETLRYVPGK